MITDRALAVAGRTAIAALAALLVASPASADPDISGEWVLDQPGAANLKLDDLPLTPAARATADAAAARAASGKLLAEGHILCLPDGMPHMMAAPYAIAFLQTRGRITVLPEVSNLPRVIYLDEAKHPDDVDPSWTGHSIGHWEGETLVVDTIGFNDRFAMLFNAHAQVRRSAALHVVERIALGKDGYLRDEMTLIDPAVFTRPYAITYRYRHLDAAETMESVCEVNPALVAQFTAEQKTTATRP